MQPTAMTASNFPPVWAGARRVHCYCHTAKFEGRVTNSHSLSLILKLASIQQFIQPVVPDLYPLTAQQSPDIEAKLH